MSVLHKFQIHNSKFIIPALLFWQLISVYLMATGVWPAGVAWVNLVFLIVYILCASTFSGLLLVVASIPFYIVLPQHYSDTLSMWRPVVALLFLRVIIEFCRAWLSGFSPREGRLAGVVENGGNSESAHKPRLTATSPNPSSWRRGAQAARDMLSSVYDSLFSYEKLAIGLFIIGALSLGLARYPVRGAAQLVFLLNTLLLYPVVVWAVKSR
jgi:hypothetical protein